VSFSYGVHTPPEALIETPSVLSILITRSPAHISSTAFNLPPWTVLAALLSHPRPVVHKRAIITLWQFRVISISQPAFGTNLLDNIILPFLSADAAIEKQRTTVVEWLP
jgi:cullin-associated NEDD8-dissociated protein 1